MITMAATIVNGKKIAQEIRRTIATDVQHFTKAYGIEPRITSILVGNDPSSELYLKLRTNACNEVGITSTLQQFEADVSEKTILQTIQHLNNDPLVHGIFIQYPVPLHLSASLLMRSVDPKKDVEGFHPQNLGRTMIGEEDLVPCTPLSVLTILQQEQIALQGKDVVIVNHSNIVGKPLAALLLNRNATVAICHVYTRNLPDYTAKADIVITGAGVPKLITKNHIKHKAVVVDVGIIKTKNGISGDVDFESVQQKASVLTPVPGGVGPVTIACALSNMMRTYHNCVEKK